MCKSRLPVGDEKATEWARAATKSSRIAAHEASVITTRHRSATIADRQRPASRLFDAASNARQLLRDYRAPIASA